MSEIERLAAAIKTISEKYLTNVVKSGDEAGITKWSLRLADYSTRLAVLASPHAALARAEVAELAPAEAVPNFGESRAMSSGLYSAWVTDWIQRHFPEAYVNWPPEVRAISPEAIVAAAKEDGCLAQVCAAGVLGVPGGAWDAMGDWSLFTGLVGTDGVNSVWHMGKLVGTTTEDGLEYAKSLGFDW